VRQELVERYYQLSLREGNRSALSERFKQTKPGALAARIPDIKIPTLILWGAKDKLIPLKHGERFDQEIQGSQMVVFDGLGHVPHEEDPQATVDEVLRFLN
jgi:pimeloyl-ACP methyl ester carboxylesterase